jgi:hypothetical protein
MSSEVTTGYGNLQGYELYDLVALSDQEYAVVIHVGSEKLKVIDNKSMMMMIMIMMITITMIMIMLIMISVYDYINLIDVNDYNNINLL